MILTEQTKKILMQYEISLTKIKKKKDIQFLSKPCQSIIKYLTITK